MLLPSKPSHAPKRLVQPSDISRTVRLGSLAISPSGRAGVFSRIDLNEAGDGTLRTLWSLDLEQNTVESLEGSEANDHDFAWSPDGSKISFLRSFDGHAQVHIALAKGGTATTLTSAEEGVECHRWSPNGKQIAYVACAKPRDLPRGVRISTRADWTSKFEYRVLPQIWIVPADTGRLISNRAKQLTDSSSTPTLSFWSSDSQKVYYTTNDTLDPYYGEAKSSLRSIDVSGGSEQLVRPLTVPYSNKPLPLAPTFIPSPDGSLLAFSIGNHDAPRVFAQDQVYIMNLESGTVEHMTDNYDRDVGGGNIFWLDNSRILTTNQDRGNVNLVEIDAEKHQVIPWWSGQLVVDSFALGNGGSRILAIASDFVTPPEIYDISERETARKLTSINAFLPEELLLTVPEKLSYRGPGGQDIHGYLHKPPDFDEEDDQKYPMIVLAHGGPHAAWTSAYNPEIQAIAAAGYLVMYVNPRGSSSYGQAFASSLSVGWPGPEFDDIMAGVEHLLSTRRRIDGDQLGIAGRSAGGTLVDWAITHTDLFSAAVSVSSIADFEAYWFLGDQPAMGATHSQPWINARDKERSPVVYGTNVATPTLFVAGTEDRRTPSAVGADIMFRLLKNQRVPAARVQFEGAGHAVSVGSCGDPRHPGLCVFYLLRWMDRHVRGWSAEEFDVGAV